MTTVAAEPDTGRWRFLPVFILVLGTLAFHYFAPDDIKSVRLLDNLQLDTLQHKGLLVAGLVMASEGGRYSRTRIPFFYPWRLAGIFGLLVFAVVSGWLVLATSLQPIYLLPLLSAGLLFAVFLRLVFVVDIQTLVYDFSHSLDVAAFRRKLSLGVVLQLIFLAVLTLSGLYSVIEETGLNKTDPRWGWQLLSVCLCSGTALLLSRVSAKEELSPC